MIKFLYKYIFEVKVKFVAYYLLSLVLLGLNLLLPWLNSQFIDSLVYNPSTKGLNTVVLNIVITNAIIIIISYTNNIIFVKLTTTTTYKVINNMMNHLTKVSIVNIYKYDPSYLTKRIVNDSNAVIQFVLNNSVKIFSNFFILCFCTLFLTRGYGYSVSGLLIIFIPIYVALYMILKKPLYNSNSMLLENQNKFFSLLNRTLKKIKYLKIKVLFEENEKNINDEFINVFGLTIKAGKLSYIFSSLNNIVNTTLYIIILLVAGMKIVNNQMKIGELTIITSYMALIVSAITYFLNLGESYQKTKFSYERLSELYNISLEWNGNNNISSINNIELKDVSFSYIDTEKTISEFSYKFTLGNVYCIAGANGAGKSTLIDLMTGILTERYTGEILYNGNNIKEVDMYKLRKAQIGVVQQEPILNVDTIYNNLVYNTNNDNIEKLQKFLDEFQLTDMIESLPNKINTIIHDDFQNISGGEKQKISIINALLKESSLLIMDEPTSALDTYSIDMLKNYIYKAKKNKIIIVIAHSEDIIRVADYVIRL